MCLSLFEAWRGPQAILEPRKLLIMLLVTTWNGSVWIDCHSVDRAEDSLKLSRHSFPNSAQLARPKPGLVVVVDEFHVS